LSHHLSKVVVFFGVGMEESMKDKAEKLVGKKITCEQWRKILKKLKKKKPDQHPQMPTIIIQVNNARHKSRDSR
jgi:hypothetical protein